MMVRPDVGLATSTIAFVTMTAVTIHLSSLGQARTLPKPSTLRTAILLRTMPEPSILEG
jgi:hypothetical protein